MNEVYSTCIFCKLPIFDGSTLEAPAERWIAYEPRPESIGYEVHLDCPSSPMMIRTHVPYRDEPRGLPHATMPTESTLAA